MWKRIFAYVTAFFLGALPMTSQAFHLPKWEYGVGLAALHLPAYRGAKGSDTTWLPFPYITYRGDRLRIDEEGIRGKLMEKERVRLDFSLAGNLPVGNEEDSPREGMSELDPVGEVGPTLDVSLWQRGHRHVNGEVELWLRTPLRAVLSVGEPLLAHRGWVFSPSLDLVYRVGKERSLNRWSFSIGPLYGTEHYHDYFYEVKKSDVVIGRDEFHPSGGYSGARATLTLTMNMDKWFIGAFIRKDNLRGAAFEASPLVETNSYLAMGLAVSRIFGASTEMAPH